MKKIYISGKITGIEYEAVELFANAQTMLREKGYHTVNPLELNHTHDKSWRNFMREDVKAMCECDIIYMLDNWMDSKGARAELQIAILLEMKVYYHYDTIPDLTAKQ